MFIGLGVYLAQKVNEMEIQKNIVEQTEERNKNKEVDEIPDCSKNNSELKTIFDAGRCYEELGKVAGDTSFCDSDKMEWNEHKLEYNAACLRGVEIATKNFDICPDFAKLLCCTAVAEVDGNLDNCDKIEDYNCKLKCYHGVAKLKKDFSICEKIPKDYRTSKSYNLSYNSCLIAVGKSLKDISICEKIIDQGDRDSCYLGISESKMDTEFCGQIKEARLRDNCYRDAGLNEGDPSRCEKISDLEKKEECYVDVAVLNNDLTICNQIKSEFCIATIALLRQDFTLCHDIEDKRTKYWCYSRLALEIADPEICLFLDDISEQCDCLTSMAQSAKTCELVKECKNGCLIETAVKLEDISICNKMEEEHKEYCRMYYYENASN